MSNKTKSKKFWDEQQQQRQKVELVEFPKTEQQHLGEEGEEGEEGEVLYHWYSIFKLKQNPFQTYDYRLEREYDLNIEYVDTPASKQIHDLAVSGCSAFIKGERGSGKTTALDYASCNLKKYFVILEPRSIFEIFNEIWNLGINVRSKYFERVFRGAFYQFIDKKEYRCGGCRQKCKFDDSESIEKTMYNTLDSIPSKCIAKEWVFEKICQNKFYDEHLIFFIDAPDDLVQVGVYEFSKLVGKLLDLGGVIIITATPEQYELCQKSDTLARLPVYDFPQFTKEQLREVVIKRIQAFQNKSAPLPFNDDVIDYLIEVSNYNVRKLIYNCQTILQKMWKEQMNTSCNLEFAQKLVKKEEIRLSLNQILYETIKELKAQGKTWVYVSEIISFVKNKYNMKVSSERIGRLLSNLWKQGIILDRRELHGFIQYHL